MMADERPSIEDILAQARSQDGGSGSPEETPPPSDEAAAPAEDSAQEAEAEETPDAGDTSEPTPKPASKKAPAKAPSSTSDILAMARGQDAAGEGDADSEPAAETPAPAAEKPAQPKKPAAKPAAASDILAMARSQDASKAAGEPEPDTGDDTAASDQDEAPAEETPAAADDSDRPSVQEMLQQLRHTDGKGAAATTQTVDQDPKAPEVPVSERPMPSRPAAPEAPVAEPPPVGRRGVLITLLLLPAQLVVTPFAVAWTALAAACGAMVLGLARFMFPNTLVEPPMSFKIGPPSDYPPESVSTKFKADRAVWIIRSSMYNGQDQIVAVSTVCTHLGCTPNWLEGEQKFKCPCHGSGFYKSGVNFEGPAPRPLERHGLSLAPDGMLEVDKSKKFQEELGQWEDGGCFVEA